MHPPARKPHTDFVLSGVTSRRIASWAIAMACAYSGKWNPRRLESFFYGIWNMILCDLIDDLSPLFFVIPQCTIDTVHDGPVFPERDLEDESMRTTAAKNAKNVLPDFGIMRAEYSIRGNCKEYVPIDSDIDSSDSDSDLDGVDPLFIPPGYIAIPHISDDLPQHILNSHLVKINNLLLCLVAELKRCPTRYATSFKKFKKSLKAFISHAKMDAKKQAIQAFNSQQHTKKLLMVVACGEWWCWRIAEKGTFDNKPMNEISALPDTSTFLAGINSRDTSPQTVENDSTYEEPFSYSSHSGADLLTHDRPPRRVAALAAAGKFNIPQLSMMDLIPIHAAYMDDEEDDDDDDDDDEDDDGDDDEDDDDDDEEEEEEEEDEEEEDEEEETNIGPKRYLNLGSHMQSAMDNIDDANPPPGSWSKYLLLGTEASNQALFLIHQHLQNLGTT